VIVERGYHAYRMHFFSPSSLVCRLRNLKNVVLFKFYSLKDPKTILVVN